jgi:hypothetical protein
MAACDLTSHNSSRTVKAEVNYVATPAELRLGLLTYTLSLSRRLVFLSVELSTWVITDVA